MKPIHLIINGWGPYKGKETIDFKHLTNQGVFLITGPTGAGKTTIFDAITFALFGEVSGSIREKEGVRSDFAEPEESTYVIFEFTHRGEVYEIERNPKYYRPKKRGSGMVAVKENAVLRSKDVVLAEGSREVTAKMEELLSLNYKQFTQISMLAQGEFQKLLTTTGSERTKVFRNLFHTEVCEKLQTALADKSKKLHESLKENQARVWEITATVMCEGDEWKELAENAHVNIEPVEKFLERDLEEKKHKWECAKKEYEECTSAIKECIKWKEEAKYQIELTRKKEEAERQLVLLEAKRKEYEQQKKDLKIVEKAQNLLLLEAEYLRNIALEKTSKRECEKLSIQEKDAGSIWEKSKQEFQKNPEKKEKITQLEELIRKIQEKKKYAIELQTAKEDLEKNQQDFLESQKQKQEKKELYEQAEKKYKMATAGLLAKDLEENMPCPVCGSLVHPQKAKLNDEVPDKEYLEGLKENYEKALEKENEVHAKAVAANSKIQIITENMKKISVLEAGNELKVLEQEKKKEKESLAMEVEQIENNYHQSTINYQNISNLYKVRLKEWKEHKSIAESSQQQYEKALLEHGFTNAEEFRLVKEKSDKKEQFKKAVKEFEEAFLLYKERKDNVENELKKQKRMNFDEVSEKLKAAEDKEVELRKILTELQSCYKNNKRALENLKERNLKLQELTKEYGKVSRLENVTRGRNSKNLVFEQYILSCYFDKILQAANQRLESMTSGRYLLKRVEQAGDARSRDSLYMEVFDAYTGKTRGVQSLSGGESFKAALSLALGMSDMIQSLSGGIVVETLFVDEGFGSLDEESLDQAVEVLTNLARQQYTIGIISHVKELKEKVDRQLFVEKCRTGSRIVS